MGTYSVRPAVKLIDTTPPAASVRNVRTYINKPVPASDFAYNIKDASPVTVRYETPPDFSVPGEQAVNIILEDAYGNITEYSAELTVVSDTTPPVISGNLNKTVKLGEKISYTDGITVTDDYDPDVKLVVDSGGVNLSKAGVYNVIYSATDESGNRTEVIGTVTVKGTDMDLVNEMADKILVKIITENMSGHDKAYAIYNWVIKNMRYVAGDGTDLVQAAYQCFTTGRGDCFVYYAASRVLLTRAGIENRAVQRFGGVNEHYWNLVNTGGGWHHFDTCPTPGNAVTTSQRFMFTESQAKEYTRVIVWGTQKNYYYVYDKSTVPEVVG
jgi:hypothetical protein